MSKFSNLLIAGSAFGLALAASGTTASAGHYGYGGGYGGGCHHGCRPPRPVYNYKTIYQHRYVNRVHNVYTSKHINRPRYVYTVTRYQPIIHVHHHTRVHRNIYYHTYNVYLHRTTYLPPIYTSSSSTSYHTHVHCNY